MNDEFADDAQAQEPQRRQRGRPRRRPLQIHPQNDRNLPVQPRRPQREAAIAAIEAIRDMNLNDIDRIQGRENEALCELDNFIENTVPAHTLEPMNKVCNFCSALTFLNESRGFCCSNGKTVLEPLNAPPQLLLNLFQNAAFRKNIRKYNQAFAFTSLGVTVDERLANGRDGVYTFRIHGQLCHRIGALMPAEGQPETYGQIYFLDAENQAQRRGSIFKDLNHDNVLQIGALLHEINPFAQVFKNAGDAIANEENIALVIRADLGQDQRRYNAPTSDHIAAIIPDNTHATNPRDIIIQRKQGPLQKISELHQSYVPMQYPLLFPHGESGWFPERRSMTNEKLTMKDWVSYHLQVRENTRGRNLILMSGRLFQQFVVDMYAAIEHQRLMYLKHHQSQLRAESYATVRNLLNEDAYGNVNLANVGQKVILPSSFTGGPRYMNQKYQDAMAIVREFGKPDLFITVTCNPKWTELQEALDAEGVGLKSEDRPDIACRVFHEKLKQIKKDIIENQIFGRVVAHIHVIEFQKRGLPHCHMLVILHPEDKLRDPASIDRIVSAEIPDVHTQPILHASVTKHMIHGPCGVLNARSPCMEDGHCAKKFPKEFAAQTVESADGFPIYRRRDNGRMVTKRTTAGEVQVDNRFVVPYNPYLIKKYDCHINVEVCCSVKSVKYLYKYVYKGHDAAVAEVSKDEIKEFINARYVSAHEAVWRIFELPLFGCSHTITRLPVHLPDQQRVYFHGLGDAAQVVEARKLTQLEAFFELCQTDEFAQTLKYQEVPVHYVWQSKERSWKKRERNGKDVIARMYTVNPGEGERFYLRILLISTHGPTSFEAIRTYDGTTYATFKEAAIARGLLEDDTEYEACLNEARTFQSPIQLRDLFVTLLIYCTPANIQVLFNNNFEALCEDMRDIDTVERKEAAVLKYFADKLATYGKQLTDFPGLPPLREDLVPPAHQNNLIHEELHHSQESINAGLANVPALNAEQRAVFDAVINAVTVENGNQRKHFFVDGPAGTGKTFLYNAIIGQLRSQRKIVLVVASSGIAAYLLPGGRTAHSRFKIPLSATPESLCNISKQSDLAQLIRVTNLIIWDEAVMTNKVAYETLNRSLQDIIGNDLLFGDIPVLFGGDFRQILPVVLKGNQAKTLQVCLKNSPIWAQLQKYTLIANQRARDDNAYSDFVLRIGEGTFPTDENGLITLPQNIMCPGRTVESLIDTIFPNLNENIQDRDYIINRVILTPKNDDTDDINNKIAANIAGDAAEYFSADSVDDDNGENLYPREFLNSLSPSGMPPHHLILKVGIPIILLRNLDASRGLCNGTRLIVRALQRHVIDAEIAVGRHQGARVFIPRICLSPSETTLPFKLRRKQFPVKLCFAMTINKSQGQTLNQVGLYLPNDVFSHGQLYVALSRVRSSNNIKVLTSNGAKVKNVVYLAALQQ